MTNQAAWQLADKIKDQYYKFNVKVEDIVKGLQSDQTLVKEVGADKLKRFVYSTLGALHELEPKTKEVKK